MPSVEIRIEAVIASIILAWLTYWAIEKPIRFKLTGNWRVVGLCVMLTIIGFIGFNTYQRDGLSFRMLKISPELTGVKPDVVKDWRLGKCFLEDTDQFSDICLERRKPLVFLWGDSHAAALYPGLKNQQSNYQFGIAQYTATGCKPLIGKIVSGEKYCKAVNDENMALLKKVKPDFVLLHANWSDISDLTGLEITIDSLKKAKIEEIILLGPDPLWNDELSRILFSYYRKAHTRPPLRMKENNADIAHKLDLSMRDFAKLKHIQYISSLDILCNQDGCLTRTGINSVDITTMDESHLTPQGASYQAGIILRSFLKPSLTANEASTGKR